MDLVDGSGFPADEKGWRPALEQSPFSKPNQLLPRWPVCRKDASKCIRSRWSQCVTTFVASQGAFVPVSKDTPLVRVEQIESRILVLRNEKVILDADLAALYGVPTKALNQAVKRNQDRFPDDFLFQLTAREKEEVVTNCDHLERLKYSPTLPYAFTEHGAIMAASVLNSPRAVEVSVYVVRAFVRLRKWLDSQGELAAKLQELDRKVARHDDSIRVLVAAIRKLMAPPPSKSSKRRPIGFQPEPGPGSRKK